MQLKHVLTPDMEKAMCNGKDHVYAMSKEFCLSNKYKYAIQVIEGFEDMLVTFNVQYQIANLLNLARACIECDELLKARSVEKRIHSIMDVRSGPNITVLLMIQ